MIPPARPVRTFPFLGLGFLLIIFGVVLIVIMFQDTQADTCIDRGGHPIQINGVVKCADVVWP